MNYNYCLLLSIIAIILSGCSLNSTQKHNESQEEKKSFEALKDSLTSITTKYPGEIGIALIIDSKDTITINNKDKYPLMSVFKLHQAIALCHLFDQTATSLDTIINIERKGLNPHTWSPMLKEHSEDNIRLTVKELLRYTLIHSDNNASNLMFDRLENISDTDSLIATIIPRNSFRLSVTEAEMASDHAKAYENHSSPLGVAELIEKLFNDSIISPAKQEFICTTLRQCQTGTDRIVAPLTNKKGVSVSHKTGSGFRDHGILSAHNYAAYVSLPDGRHYTLVVLVKDFNGSEKEAAKAIADISAITYETISLQKYVL